MNGQRSEGWLPYTLAAVSGFAVCFAIAQATGRREAWDATEYFSIGIPLMFVIVFVLAWHWPRRAWRWALAMAVGQAAALAVCGNSLSLWPLAIIAMTVVSVPQFVAGLIAARLSSRRVQAADGPV
ncbi:MAG: hypothetical protein Q8L65_12900 [Burkholderiales bacterium]|nr:hypothetical protein [Burkholderiales bacterium]MDP2398475.1 hypothetical protein [Burkholderiales bacterium]